MMNGIRPCPPPNSQSFYIYSLNPIDFNHFRSKCQRQLLRNSIGQKANGWRGRPHLTANVAMLSPLKILAAVNHAIVLAEWLREL